MIPEFPEFKKLELSDKAEIEAITSKYPPYSDFNFVSMWCWDTEGKMRISKLHGNLVVRFTDYLTGEPFYSFLGDNKINYIAQTLIRFSIKEGLTSQLKLIPEKTAMRLSHEIFKVEEDRNNFDYILSVEKMTKYAGTQLMSKRNYVNRFRKHYKSENKVIHILEERNKKELVKLFETWATIKGYSNTETKHELGAFTRFLEVSSYLNNLVILGIYMDRELAGFWIVEITSSKYVVSHFEKANTFIYKGIYPYLKQEMSLVLSKKAIVYINLEQDLGIPGLRKAKMDYRPCTYLRKYKVELSSIP